VTWPKIGWARDRNAPVSDRGESRAGANARRWRAEDIQRLGLPADVSKHDFWLALRCSPVSSCLRAAIAERESEGAKAAAPHAGAAEMEGDESRWDLCSASRLKRVRCACQRWPDGRQGGGRAPPKAGTRCRKARWPGRMWSARAAHVPGHTMVGARSLCPHVLVTGHVLAPLAGRRRPTSFARVSGVLSDDGVPRAS
jgi:hypothetical protein